MTTCKGLVRGVRDSYGINHLVDFSVDHQVQILVNRSGTMDVSMGRIRPSPCVSVDPLQPVFGSMASNQILKIIGGRNSLGL